MAEESMRMPSAGGGIVRYFDEYKSKIQFKPAHIVVIIILFVIFELIMHNL